MTDPALESSRGFGVPHAIWFHAAMFFTMLRRATGLKCPRCGGGGIFTGWFTMVERCRACGHKFERIDGYWVGAMIISFALTAGAFLLVFLGGVVIWWPDPPYTALLIASLIIGGLTPVVAFPWSRTFFVALELATHPLEPHEEAAALKSIEEEP